MMKERFAIRFGVFALVSLLIGFLLGSSNGGTFQDCLLASGFVLCLIYSGRLLWPIVSRGFSTLTKAGFVAILFGSLPAIVIVLIAMFFLAGFLLVLCVMLGIVQIIKELVKGIMMDAAAQ